jgi:2-amino-4-hydroxy-6-hydroxymethyldihydropteridine diphosphokinase
MTRVANLMDEWGEERGIPALDRTRWRAAGHLHDALREEKPETLRTLLAPDFQDLPGKVLHGPGAAFRLAHDGVEDIGLLHAIRFHTLGSAEFDPLGLALYAADFLEPGRRRREEWRSDLRARAGADLEGVVREIIFDRIHYLLDRGRPVHPITLGFWNRFSEGESWASASEC